MSVLVIRLPQPGVTLTVHCEHCGHANVLERRVLKAERIEVICHGCETPLAADWVPPK